MVDLPSTKMVEMAPGVQADGTMVKASPYLVGVIRGCHRREVIGVTGWLQGMVTPATATTTFDHESAGPKGRGVKRVSGADHPMATAERPMATAERPMATAERPMAAAERVKRVREQWENVLDWVDQG
jgi:hypothetical protein